MRSDEVEWTVVGLPGPPIMEPCGPRTFGFGIAATEDAVVDAAPLVAGDELIVAGKGSRRTGMAGDEQVEEAGRDALG